MLKTLRDLRVIDMMQTNNPNELSEKCNPHEAYEAIYNATQRNFRDRCNFETQLIYSSHCNMQPIEVSEFMTLMKPNENVRDNPIL